MKIERQTVTVTTKSEQEIESVQISDNLYVVRRAETVTRSPGPKSHPKADTQEFFVDRKNHGLMSSGLPFKVLPECAIVTSVEREALLTGGVSALGKEMRKNQARHARPFENWVAGGNWSVDNILIHDWQQGTYQDIHGKYVQEALQAGYMMDSGYFSEGTYDLAKAAEHLSKRTDVRLHDHYGRPVAPDQLQQAIEMIPHYNAERGRTLTLNFTYMPDPDTADRLMRHAVENRAKYLSRYASVWQQIFEQDLLGLRAAGCARHEDYMISKPSKDARDDDDDDIVSFRP